MSLTSYRAAPPRVESALPGSARILSAGPRVGFRSPWSGGGLRPVLVGHCNIKAACRRPEVSAGPSLWGEDCLFRLLAKACRLFGGIACCVWQTWQRPTLPRLETKYHGRRGVSRPCSERERVQPPRHNHQVSEAQRLRSWRGGASLCLNTS